MNFPFNKILPFVILVSLCAMVLALADHLSKDRITDNIQMEKLQVISTVMTSDFDNDIYHDVKTIDYLDNSGNQLTTNVYRARKSGEPVGVVFMPIFAKGYNGTINLSIGILHDGTLFGVQVLTHKETVGLGANVHQDQSGWLKQFARQSFAITPAESWSVTADSGHFDQISGATITSRGVINAIKNSLQLYATEQDTLFAE